MQLACPSSLRIQLHCLERKVSAVLTDTGTYAYVAVADDSPECSAGSLDFQVTRSLTQQLSPVELPLVEKPTSDTAEYPCMAVAGLIRIPGPNLLAARPVRGRRLAAAL